MGSPLHVLLLIVQIDTMKCFYCPQKDLSLVPWDLLSPADQNFLRDKYPDAGQGAVCDFCVCSACPSSFFNRHSSGASSSAAQSGDSRLQVPLVVSGAATSVATESVEAGVICVHLSSCGRLCWCTVHFPHQIDHSKAGNVVIRSLCAFTLFRQALFVH